MNPPKKFSEVRTFDELLEVEYGPVGTPKRDEHDAEAQAFVVSQMIREARKEARMTQEELAAKTGTPKSYISQLERGKCDVPLSTLLHIFAKGLGRQLRLFIS